MPDKQKIREFIDGLKDDDKRLSTLEDFIVNHLGDDDEDSEPEPLQAYTPVGKRIIGTLENVTGTALLLGFDPETKEHIYAGQTDIDWNSQVTQTDRLSGPMYVDEIGDIWFRHQLSFRLP